MGTEEKTNTSGLGGSGEVVRLLHIDAYALRAGIKSSMVRVYLRSLLLLWELSEAVSFILQCCRASLAISEINFWAASEMNRIMRGSEASKPARFRY